jgi:4,5-DOPA dioxygenase extradiol
MDRKHFLTLLGMAPVAMSAMNLREFSKIVDELPSRDAALPVLFTSHGNPMDIVKTRDERPFWQKLYDLGRSLENSHEIRGVLVVSAHWCTRGTFVNVAPVQEQIYDYHGFPDEYYQVTYHAKGAPDLAREVTAIVPDVVETTEWGLDHGAWPMLMHLFPNADVPVFQMSIDYYASPTYHYELGKQLKALRKKGILIIGSGSLIHNLSLAFKKMRENDMTPYGWEAEYDAWLKKQIDGRNIDALINYETSHKLGKLAAPTPDHYVPVLYSLGLMDSDDDLTYFYDGETTLPAFSERSFLIGKDL